MRGRPLLSYLKKEIREQTNRKRAANYKKFFKTGKGEYGEGDKFLGLTSPQMRAIAKKYWKDLPLGRAEILLKSSYHEERQIALLILVAKFLKYDKNEKKKIYNLYIKNVAKYVNNWDLVDLSAHNIVGAYLEDKERKILYKFARSENLWERRVSIISTYHFIKNGDFRDTLKLAEILLNDKHDLIHKAVGWMLREIGNRDRLAEEKFLKRNYKKMPRTMLRYAIEKFPETLRQKYLKNKI